MSEQSVKRALSYVVGSELRYFSLVNTNIRVDPNGEEDDITEELMKFYYLCLGKHSIHFLDRDMIGKEEFGGTLVTIPYGCIESVEYNPPNRDSELFRINFSVIPPNVTCPYKLLCHSTMRKKLLGYFEICWKTDFMFQHWHVKTFPKFETKEGLLPRELDRALPDHWRGDQQGASAEFTYAPAGYTKQEIKDYLFFSAASFTPKIESNGKNDSGLFVSIPASRGTGKTSKSDSKASAFKMHMETRPFFFLRISELETLEDAQKVTCKQIAEHSLEIEVGKRLLAYRIMGTPGEYFKTQNLTGDPASWETYSMHIRGLEPAPGSDNRMYGNRDIAIMVARRKYIPPVMDMAQTFVLIFYGKNLDQSSMDGGNFLKDAECIIDTMSPRNRSFEPDRLVVQTKANALLFNDDAYAWYQSRLCIFPTAIKRAKQFCKSILRLLDRVNLGDGSTDTDQVFPEVSVDIKQDDPFEFASRLEKESNGLSDNAPAALHLGWKARVWQYIAYCVDGGLCPHLLRIDSLVYDHQMMTSGTRESERVAHVLETMLYLRPTGQPYRHIPLVMKLQDSKTMSNFSFNERVMVRLLETDYLKRLVGGRSDVSEYPRFLVRLIKHCSSADSSENHKLKYAVCKQLVTMSVTDLNVRLSEARVFVAADDVSMNMVVPVLINLLYAKDDNIKVLAVVSLVNYTNNHPAMKNAVMAGGGVRKVVTFLGSANEDLVWHSCKLLAGCTKHSEQYRQTIAQFGIIPRLINLLEKSEVPPYYRPLPILIQVAAVLGYLAHDARIRNEMTEFLSKPPPAVPKLVKLLHELLKPNAPIDDLTDESKKESLYFFVINCLKNLAVRNAENKRAMKRVLRTLRIILVGDEEAGTVGTKDSPLISVILECLYVLSYDSAIRKICNDNYEREGETFGFGIMNVLKRYEGIEDVSDLVTFLRDLYDRTG
jgi:hypothetical protein